MNKFKKLLLTLAPLSAVAIATPIILTSCSTNATNPSGPSDQKPGDGNGNGEIGENGKLNADETNDKNFKPKTENGLFQKVETTVKSGKLGEEEKQVDAAFVEYTTATEEDAKDAIKIWSNNKWLEATKNENVTYSSSLVDLTVAKKEVSGKNKWDISFKYKFQLAVTQNDKTENILAEKSYNVSDYDLADKKGVVDFTTTPTLFTVDGKNALENKGDKTLFAENEEQKDSKVVESIKTFLNEGTSKFDAKANFKEFVKNHEIKGEQEQVLAKPIWNETEIAKDTSLSINEDKTEVSLNLTSTKNPTWGNCESANAYAAIKKTFENPNYQNKIKALIDGKDYNIVSLACGDEVKGDKNSDMNVTISFTKKDGKEGTDSNPTLVFKVKGFAKTA